MRKRYKLISKLHCMIDIFIFITRSKSEKYDLFTAKGEIKVADMCTGIATNTILLQKQPQATVIGVDVSRICWGLLKEESIKNILKCTIT